MNIDDMKCCGNCKFIDCHGVIDSMNRPVFENSCVLGSVAPSWHVCDCWEYDDYDKSRREELY